MMLSSLPKEVSIVEVGPRDGLQNEKVVLETQDKIEFIGRLLKSGLKRLEITSFVRADRIPQMADAIGMSKELFIKQINEFSNFIALVPNEKGLENALQCGFKEIAVFTATSELFNKKNINATIAESLQRIKPVCEQAVRSGVSIRGYISTAFGCPYEGQTDPLKAVELTKILLSYGAREVSIGDTIGVAGPKDVSTLVGLLKSELDIDQIAMHFHDTRGLALTNILTSLDLGIKTFDSSAGGLGGCPYAKGATGNVATEDLVYLCEKLGVNTGVDLNKLISASDYILKKMNKISGSKYAIAQS